MKTKPRPASAPAALPLPHERDEIASGGARRRSAIVQAERDVRRGLVDTDNYTRARDVAALAPAPRKRSSRR